MMNWYSGDIAQCIKDVKTENKLLLVFSKGEFVKFLQRCTFLLDGSDVSNEVYGIFNGDSIASHCRNMICKFIATIYKLYTVTFTYTHERNIICGRLAVAFGISAISSVCVLLRCAFITLHSHYLTIWFSIGRKNCGLFGKSDRILAYCDCDVVWCVI